MHDRTLPVCNLQYHFFPAVDGHCHAEPAVIQAVCLAVLQCHIWFWKMADLAFDRYIHAVKDIDFNRLFRSCPSAYDTAGTCRLHIGNPVIQLAAQPKQLRHAALKKQPAVRKACMQLMKPGKILGQLCTDYIFL